MQALSLSSGHYIGARTDDSDGVWVPAGDRKDGAEKSEKRIKQGSLLTGAALQAYREVKERKI
eukprot:714842-Hanusia_phi.AAC.1